MRPLFLVIALMTLLPPASHAAPPPDDPALWLEEVTGDRALEWVRQQDAAAASAIAETPLFKELDARFLTIFDSRARIPGVRRIGGLYYNFWQDAEHPRGLWRRTTLEEYRKDAPAWETVLDLDALGAAEGAAYVWKGADVLESEPAPTRCLVSLSRGGADATLVREFDLGTKGFVPDGFTLPESKSSVGWIDRDRLYVACAFDSTTLTTSGYARVVKEWRRGTALADAPVIFEGRPTDALVAAAHDDTPGFERDFVYRLETFFSNEVFLRRGTGLVRIDKPNDVDMGPWREWMFLTPRSDWTVDGVTHKAGSLLVTRFDDFLAGARRFDTLFEPTERTSLAGYTPLENALLLNVLDNVRNRVSLVRRVDGRWEGTPLPGAPENSRVAVEGVDPRDSDDYWMTVTDFLTPTSLSLGTAGGGPAEVLKRSPSYFDASGSVVTQHEAVSKDGTRVPYFQIAPKGMRLDGRNPTLMIGYGGFQVPQLPVYSGTAGAGWIERGGVYVSTNIRGGGEFGPAWHQAAILANRDRAYEDFIAIAEDLVKRKVTSPKHLGCTGGSNGGLLVGNMLTRRPDLFGAIICESPLLDMQRYHKLLAGASWMSEYGDPDDPQQWAFIRGFSPLHNLKAGVKYPPTLFTSSTRDDRVHPAHARRMVHRMLALGAKPLYYENIEGGHAGAANNAQRAYMTALLYTFAWRHLGGR